MIASALTEIESGRTAEIPRAKRSIAHLQTILAEYQKLMAYAANL